MIKASFEVHYYHPNGTLSHTYSETYIYDSSLRCPHCSKSTVWVEDSEGDFYQGPTHICKSCGSSFTLSLSPESKNLQDKQRVKNIKRSNYSVKSDSANAQAKLGL